MEKLQIYNEKDIIDLYQTGNSTRDIQKLVRISSNTVLKILIKNDIPRRNKSESVALALQNDILISNYIQQVIDGELLGDGHITIGKYQSCFSYGTSQKDYAEWLAGEFSLNNLPAVGVGVYMSNSFYEVRKKAYLKYHFNTISTLQLKELRKRWYNDRTKIVPEDLVLTKISVLHWWIGDGTNNKVGGHGWIITDSFTKEEVETLSIKLNELVNIESKVNLCKAGEKLVYRIYIPRVSLEKLLDFIGPCPVECYNYKWRKKQMKRRGKTK